MFPDPSEDPWYEVFVSMPLSWVEDSRSSELKLARPLNVTCYRYASEDMIRKILGRTMSIWPNPLYPAVQESLSMKLSTRSSGSRQFYGRDATRILAETPIVGWFISNGSETLNQAILSGDINDAVEAVDPTASGQSDRVPLSNVFMEFSPLDNPDWYRVGDAESDVQQLRALWLVSHDDRFGIYLFAQRVMSRDVEMLAAGPFEYVFDADRAAFWRRDPDKGFAVKVRWDRPADRAFKIALSVLRFLSPVTKADPFPVQHAQREDGTYVMTIPVRGAVARLKRVMEPVSNQHWYLLKDSRTNEAFFPGSEASYLGTLELELAVPWPEADAGYVRSIIPRELKASDGA
jgi:hypothetical protein